MTDDFRVSDLVLCDLNYLIFHTFESCLRTSERVFGRIRLRKKLPQRDGDSSRTWAHNLTEYIDNEISNYKSDGKRRFRTFAFSTFRSRSFDRKLQNYVLFHFNEFIAKDTKIERTYDVSRLTMVLCIWTGLFDHSRYSLFKEGRATFFYKRTYYAIALFVKLVFLSHLLSGSNVRHVFVHSMLRSSYETRDVIRFFFFFFQTFDRRVKQLRYSRKLPERNWFRREVLLTIAGRRETAVEKKILRGRWSTRGQNIIIWGHKSKDVGECRRIYFMACNPPCRGAKGL